MEAVTAAPIAYGVTLGLGHDDAMQLLLACEIVLSLLRGDGGAPRLCLDADASALDALADALARGGRTG